MGHSLLEYIVVRSSSISMLRRSCACSKSCCWKQYPTGNSKACLCAQLINDVGQDTQAAGGAMLSGCLNLEMMVSYCGHLRLELRAMFGGSL